jgi:hypothetical protein
VGPIPNIIAGILIGVLIHSAIAFAMISLGWAAVFCVGISVFDKGYVGSSIQKINDRGQRLFWGSPRLNFYVIVYSTALSTTVFFGVLTYGIKYLILCTLPAL